MLLNFDQVKIGQKAPPVSVLQVWEPLGSALPCKGPQIGLSALISSGDTQQPRIQP